MPVSQSNGSYKETALSTTNTRLAAVLLIFGARLDPKLPLEWVDLHEDKESFIRHQENPGNCIPKPKITFHFQGINNRARNIIEAFDIELEKLDAELDVILAGLPPEVAKQIEEATTKIIARACHETLLQREELVKLIKSVPTNARWDGIVSGRTVVQLGKRSSPEVRARYLSHLP